MVFKKATIMPSKFYEKRLIQNRCRLTSPAGVESQHRQAHAFGNFGRAFQDFAAAVENRMSGLERRGGAKLEIFARLQLGNFTAEAVRIVAETAAAFQFLQSRVIFSSELFSMQK